MKERRWGLERAERRAVAVSFAYFFVLLAGYQMLKPIRDAMGIAGGTSKLPWMYTATFVCTLIVSPLFAAVLDRWPRWFVAPRIYLFLSLNLLVFFALMRLQIQEVWTARAFFVWVSVYNLFLTSMFWSLMADTFRSDQARRVYGLIAAGGTAGAVAGPTITALLVERVGAPQLILLSIATLLASAVLVRRLEPLRFARDAQEKPLRGNALEGLVRVVRSPQLAAIAGTTILFAYLSTHLYFVQAAIVEQSLSDTAARAAWFARVEVWTQSLTIGLQFVLTGFVLQRLGVMAGLIATPLVGAIGLATLASAPTLGALASVQTIRRAFHYALERPARESLFNALSPEDKFKSKNVIDTVVYRATDASSAWTYQGLASVGAAFASAIALLAAGLGGVLAIYLGRRSRETTDTAGSSAPKDRA
jgi:AAA family ATP:ADP antiporter